MLAVAVAAVVDTAARDDGHVRAFTDKEVVIDHVGKAGLRQDDRDVHGLVLRERRDADVDAVLVGLGLDDDMLGIAAEGLLPVGADVDRALAGALHVRDNFQNLLLDLVQHGLFPPRRLQPVTVSAMIFG